MRDCRATAVAHVEREVVDVHGHEAVGGLFVDAASELHRIRERLVAVREARGDRLPQDGGDVVATFDVAADADEPERQRQPDVLVPPEPEVEQLGEPGVGVRELALVDEQPRVGAARHDLVQHLVERKVARADPVAEREVQHALRGRQRAGRDDLDLVQVDLAARDDDRAVALAERRAVRQEDVACSSTAG